MDKRRRMLLKAMAMGMGAGCLAPAAAWANATAFDLSLRGQDLLARGETQAAIDVLKRAASMDSGNEWAWGLLGRAYYQAGDMRRAVDSFKRVLKINPGDTYSRMMMDMITQKPVPPAEKEQKPLSPLEKNAREEEERIFSRLESKSGLEYQIRRIVLDAGHGGFDPGAVGPSGLQEKNIVLDLVRRTSRILNKKAPNVHVYLSRTEDYYMPLSDRTTTANQYNADLFVSFHINANSNPRAHGMETYFCSEKASSKEAARVAKFENSVIKYDKGSLVHKGYVNIEEILFLFERKSYWRTGGEAAGRMQKALAGGMDLRNRGVHSANFYVLRRARMPSILLETGFISNPREEELLKKADFREKLAAEIASGMEKMIRGGV